jgi:NAD(P)-dependent dehydrogenase (short-subunit alcohol dehydrogenase family)
MTGAVVNASSSNLVQGALDGRVVVVTGGSMGIGLACAEAVLQAGGRVVIAARGETALAAAADRLASLAGADSVVAHRCDVADADAVDGLFEAAAARFGRVDGVVHAAAVIGPIGRVTDVEPEQWMDALRTDLFGSFLVLRAAAQRMSERGGRIVLLSGGGATGAFPNYSAYACSKAGVVRLAETAAHELAPLNITVNALAPGFVATRMHEETLAAGERAGRDYLERTRQELLAGGVPPQLAADAAVFLLSDASEGITGRLYAAAWDDHRQWSGRRDRIAETDYFTLRRIVPRDRGEDWQ